MITTIGLRRHAAWLLAATATVAFSAPRPALAQGFGTIKGRLVWAGGDVPKPKVLVAKGDATVKDAQVCASHEVTSKELAVDPATKGIQYGFAYLVNPKGKNADAEKALVAKSPTVVIDQVNCEYVPFSTALFGGQTVTFKSSDPINHNVHWAGFTNQNNQMLGPKSELKVTLQPERRPIPLTCDIHPWMKGSIMVFNHPFFAVTKQDGSFEIQGVPPGEQRLVVSQATGVYASEGRGAGMPVTVKPGQVTDVGEIKVTK